uniref:G_PROTEIN_RECEP_F1_2 domain-containing protein n=1 Tax=Panagrellus redivivus TaxID=6233 RepID=A0A7E4VV62_PANRE
MSTDASCTQYNTLYKDPSSHILTVAVFAVIYSFIFVAGLLGNAAVLIVTYRHRSLQTVQNIFILNLAISSLILCLLSLPLTPVSHIYKQWFFGSVMCKVAPGIQAFVCFLIPFSLCAIAVDRYFNLVIAPGRPLQRDQAVKITIALWAISVIMSLPYVYHMHIITYTKKNICGEFCTEKWPNNNSKRIYTFIVLMTQAFVPFSIMAACYRSVFAFLRKRATTRLTSIAQQANMLYLLAATAGGDTSVHSDQLSHLFEQKKRVARQKRRVTIILVLMVVLFGLSQLPFNIVALITEFDSEYAVFTLPGGTDISYLVNLFAHCMAMTSCVTNPVLYAFLNPEFRELVLKSIKWAPEFVSRTFQPTQTSAV